MAKIEINQVAEIIKRNDIEPDKARQIIEELNLLAQPEGEDEEKAPAVKKQFSILVSDPEGKLASGEFTGWVVQIPEDASVTSTAERIHKAAYEFNTTKKGRMLPAKTMGDAIENIPAKHFKEQQVWIKTKAPVFVVTTDNEIPMEKTDRRSEGVAMSITTGDKTVTLTSEQMRRASERLERCVETRDGRKITRDEMMGEIKAKFEGGAK